MDHSTDSEDSFRSLFKRGQLIHLSNFEYIYLHNSSIHAFQDSLNSN
jgi:hypothetical protein